MTAPTYTISVPDTQPGIPPGDRWCALSGPRAPLPAILGTADEWLLIAGAIEAGKDRASGALRFMPGRVGGWLDVMTHIDGGVYLTTAELVELAADIRAKLAPASAPSPHPSDITREAIIARAKALTAGPFLNYEVDDAPRPDGYGNLLIGPGGFRCDLGRYEGTPTWHKGGDDAVSRLGQLNVIVGELLGVIDGKV